MPTCTATCWACCPSIATRGIGRRLKLRQREDALARGIDLIEWTFDPLELKNAFFNIERLGAIVRRYVREPVRHHQQSAARRPADGPLHRRMVDRFAARAARFSQANGRRSRASRSASHSRRHRRDPRARIRERAREIQQANAAQVPRRLRARPRRHRLRAHAKRDGTYLLEPCAMKTRTHHPAPDPHAAGALLRNQLLPHLRARHHPGGSRVAKASPAGAKSPPARILSTTKSGPIPRGRSCAITSPRACSARELAMRRGRRSADRAHPRPQHGARRAGSRGLGPGGAPATACRCGSRSAAARAARSPAAFRSAFRIPSSSCSRRSRPNWRPATSASR